MPHFRGVNVKVVTHDSEPLSEYGVKNLPRSNECSSYIQSETDLRFLITIEADQPFPGSSGRSHTGRVGSDPTNSKEARHYTPHPDFHLLASLYLDGRPKPERRTIIYLDPNHRHYRPSNTLSSRWVQYVDGIREHKWVFKDVVGIETIMDKLLINSEIPNEGTYTKKQEDELIAAFGTADIKGGDQDDHAGADSGRGCIKVVLERVTVGETKQDYRYRAHHSAEEKEDINMEGADAHMAALAEDSVALKNKGEGVSVIEYHPYHGDRPGEKYATYRFFYRSRDILKKFDFPEMAKEKRDQRRPRDLNDLLAYTTPLSISHPTKANAKPLVSAQHKDMDSPKSTASAIPAWQRDAAQKHNLGIGKRAQTSPRSSKFTKLRDSHANDIGNANIHSMDASDESESGREDAMPNESKVTGDRPRKTSPTGCNTSPATTAKISFCPKVHNGRFTEIRGSSNGDADAEADDEQDTDSTGKNNCSGIIKGLKADQRKRPRELDEDYDVDSDPDQAEPGLSRTEDDHGVGGALQNLSLKPVERGSASPPANEGAIAHFHAGNKTGSPRIIAASKPKKVRASSASSSQKENEQPLFDPRVNYIQGATDSTKPLSEPNSPFLTDITGDPELRHVQRKLSNSELLLNRSRFGDHPQPELLEDMSDMSGYVADKEDGGERPVRARHSEKMETLNGAAPEK